MFDNEADLIVPDAPLAHVDEDGDYTTPIGGATPMNTSNFRQKAEKTANFSKPQNKVEKVCGNFVNNARDDKSEKSDDTETKNPNLSVSLDSLVEHFDANITRVLSDLDAQTNKMAPVQVRSQDEVMSESQMWWTLTGNYGNCLPLDFSKTQIRKNQLNALRLQSPLKSSRSGEDAGYGDEEDYDRNGDEEELREALDLHQLISEQICVEGDAPLFNADQVIEEIDEMMQACDLMQSCSLSSIDRSTIAPSSMWMLNGVSTMPMTVADGCSVDSMYSSMRSPYTSTTTASTSHSNEEDELRLKHSVALSLTNKELNCISQSKLLAISSEMEHLIQEYNKDLVAALAHRDELEYEKEVKNRFITLLLNVQDQRRRATFFAPSTVDNNTRRKSFGAPKVAAIMGVSTSGSQLTNTSIPFDETQEMLSVSTLESLTRILQAIGEESPNVPNLLTEYILTVVCPSTTTSMIA